VDFNSTKNSFPVTWSFNNQSIIPPSNNTPPNNPQNATDPVSYGYTYQKDIIPDVLTLYWKPFLRSAEEISFAVKGHTSGYVAVGWSPDGEMIGSDVVVGWITEDTSKLRISSYFLSDKISPKAGNIELTNIYGEQTDGCTIIYFTRPVSSANAKIPIFKTGINHIIGSVSPVDAVVEHSLHGSVVIDFGELNYMNKLLDIHAILMFISWGFLIPFGMIWARYTRGLKHKLWFKVHRVTQSLGFLIAIAGFIMAFIAVGPLRHWHGLLGIAIITFTVVQVVYAFFRPSAPLLGHDKTIAQLTFETFHIWNARILVIFVLIQIFTGIIIIEYPKWVIIFYGTVVAVTFTVIIIREIHSEWKQRRDKMYRKRKVDIPIND
jgi:hypothetical protein